MNTVRHVVSSAAAGVAVGAAAGSPEMGTALFLAGWAIDLDYAFDYVRRWGLREGLRRMARLGVGGRNRPDTAYLLFHGYEVSALLWALAALFPASAWLWGVAMGHLFHLLLDQVTNLKGWPPTYFLTYRAFHGFAHDAIFPDRILRNRPPLSAYPLRRPVPREVAADYVSERTPPPSSSGN